jgi:hypothetical protein
VRRAAILVAAGALGLGVAGCEWNGVTTRSKASDIQTNVERICGPHRGAEPRGGVQNIMLMDKSEDDGIVTCDDGTNHYFDG